MGRDSSILHSRRPVGTAPAAPSPTSGPALGLRWWSINDKIQVGDVSLIVVDVRKSGVVRIGVNRPPGMAARRGEDPAPARPWRGGSTPRSGRSSGPRGCSGERIRLLIKERSPTNPGRMNHEREERPLA
jgi:hypothetical protein